MIDNTGFATTSVGLQAIQREQERYDALVPQRRHARKVRGQAIRVAIAHALRHVADSLEASLPTARPTRA